MFHLPANLMFGFVRKQPSGLTMLNVSVMNWFSVVACILLLVFSAGCLEQVTNKEVRAQRLDKQLICPECPGETIDQSNVEVAKQMKDLVRFQLESGWTDAEILGFFVDRYGQGILAAPPAAGFSLLVWLVPVVIFPMGLVSLMLFIHFNRRKSAVVASKTADITVDLSKYLPKVDKELGMSNRRYHHEE